MPTRPQRAPALDLDVLEKLLYAREADTPAVSSWLAESHRDPRAFWQGLKEAQDHLSPLPSKSVPFSEYDLYHDLIARHLSVEAPAFCWYDAERREGAISYAELADAASRRAAGWQRSGAAAGDVLCVVRSVGVDFVVSVVAALKLGLVLSVLPPVGRQFLATRLVALDPLHVDAEDIHQGLIPWPERILPAQVGGVNPGESDRSASYASGSVAALLFDPASPHGQLPRPLTADALYLCALRDGLIALGLRRNLAAAAPGVPFQQAQPALLLACLMSGGTFVHLEPGDVQRDPSLLVARPLRAVGIDEATRDALLREPQPVGERWGHWFRDPATSQQTELWRRFLGEAGLERSWSANLKWEAAHGGCTLFSPRRQGQVHFDVLPAAGVSWRLVDPAHPERESVTDHGLLSLLPLGAAKPEPSATASIIARRGAGWVFAGSPEGTRRGLHYPTDEVLQALEGTPGSLGASLCFAPLLGGDTASLVVLMVFVGRTAAVDEAELRVAVERRIRQEMGADHLPDRIQFFPLAPRRDEAGAVDHAWCRSQYLTGALGSKSRDELHGCLTLLRERLGLEPGSDGVVG
jgi:hypothetical protein